MSAESIAYALQAKAGWTDATLLDLALTYISNQADDSAWEEFLQGRLDEESSYDSELWS
jgi:hypothetical protein